MTIPEQAVKIPCMLKYFFSVAVVLSHDVHSRIQQMMRKRYSTVGYLTAEYFKVILIFVV